jgi:hypothetical protein
MNLEIHLHGERREAESVHGELGIDQAGPANRLRGGAESGNRAAVVRRAWLSYLSGQKVLSHV